MACMANPTDRHRVYMVFQDRYGWHCQFLEADLKTPLPRKLTFASPDKIIELVERWWLQGSGEPTDAGTGDLNGPGWSVPEPD
jgi:hypothetical protein